MNTGRRAALAFAVGVISGSFFWALLASLGLSAVLARAGYTPPFDVGWRDLWPSYSVWQGSSS